MLHLSQNPLELSLNQSPAASAKSEQDPIRSANARQRWALAVVCAATRVPPGPRRSPALGDPSRSVKAPTPRRAFVRGGYDHQNCFKVAIFQRRSNAECAVRFTKAASDGVGF